MRRIMLILIAGIIGIGITVWATKPPEIPHYVMTIHPMSGKDNPYHREYEEMLAPVVKIETESGTGSGVVFTTKNTKGTENTIYVLTAGHVVGDYSAVTVTFYSCHQDTKTQSDIEASVLITDTNRDLALLTLNSEPASPSGRLITPNYSAKLAPRDYVPYLFTPVYAVGCSLGLQPRPSQGIITSLCGLCDSVANNWEISAPILPGNSGGGVFDARTHELIGIAVWVRTYHGQLVTTMAGVVPIQQIYEFLDLATKTLRHQEKLSALVAKKEGGENYERGRKEVSRRARPF